MFLHAPSREFLTALGDWYYCRLHVTNEDSEFREVLDLVHSYIAVGTEFSPRQSNVMDCDFNNCTELVCAYVYMCMCV